VKTCQIIHKLDTFPELALCQNVFAAGLPMTPVRELAALPRSLAGFRGGKGG